VQPTPALRRVAVVGCGLVGTSVALALQSTGVEVVIEDTDPDNLRAARALTGAAVWNPKAAAGGVDVVVVCVPPSATATVLFEVSCLDMHATLTDVCSVKANPLHEAEALGVNPTRLIGGHPLAGRESEGPLGARRDLFAGRPWAICPLAGSDPARVLQILALARAVDAEPVVLSAEEHDSAVATLSHLPQLLASALSAIGGGLPESQVGLSGPGFADMTRLAASPPELWADIAARNAPALAEALEPLVAALRTVHEALVGATDGAGAARAVFGLVESGRAARARRPDKEHVGGRRLGRVAVVLRDRPGELLALFTASAVVNIEDVHIDHAPHQPTGVVDLAVLPESAAELARALRAAGWECSVKST
jgi:prephenate dehydrogenase